MIFIYLFIYFYFYFINFFRDFAVLQSCLTCMRVQKFLEVLVLGWVTLNEICKGIYLYKMMVIRKSIFMWNWMWKKVDRWGKCILDMDNGRSSQIPISPARTSPMTCSRVVQILNGRYFVDGPQYPPGYLKCIPTFKSDRVLRNMCVVDCFNLLPHRITRFSNLQWSTNPLSILSEEIFITPWIA